MWYLKKNISNYKLSFLILSRSVKAFKPASDELALPEYTYAGKNLKPHTRVYMMGMSLHGGLGVREFLRPPKGKRPYKYIHHPYRLDFGDTFDVEDIGCGYGFTVFAVKGKSGPPQFFGTGIATNCQIGYHGYGRPLETVIQPTKIDIPLSKPATIKKVACGRAHSLIWTDTEGLWTFGNNAYGQCGRPIKVDEDYSAKATFHHVKIFDHKTINQLECGQDTSFVLCDGKVYSSGWSADGQTGRGIFDNIENFGAIEGDLKYEHVIKLSCTADCTLALTDKGEVFGWGNSEYRQLIDAVDNEQSNVPRKLSLKIDDKIVDIAAAGTCCFVLTESGDVWSWGYGVLGRGPNCQTSFHPQMIPSTLLGRNILNPESKVTKLFAGYFSGAALTNTDGLYMWGRNAGGCLGLGHIKFQHFPLRVCVASSILKVSCGVDHTAVMAKSLL